MGGKNSYVTVLEVFCPLFFGNFIQRETGTNKAALHVKIGLYVRSVMFDGFCPGIS